jgi:predicted 3-demethylubiquinone-9 3-methyltransferase (glyoxalase superfamily)
LVTVASRPLEEFDDKEPYDMQRKITAFLTFDGRAEEAVEFYTSIFENSRILSTTRYEAGGPWPANDHLSAATFELAGQEFVALNGGPSFAFSQGISLFVECEDQEEVDELWEKLTDGGEPGPCGWLTDRFGVSWQIIPRALGELLADEDRDKAGRVMQAMLRMSKIEIEALHRAYEGAEALARMGGAP